jgi:coproporphyrinogen III oxidase-like Fe-S oxidoreductase
LRALRDAGCDTIKIGLESADPDVLVGIRRVHDDRAASAYLDQVRAVVVECRQIGLICRLFVMVGLPYQTSRSIGRTAEYLRKVQPQRLHVKPFQWYPGIALAQSVTPDAADQAAMLRAAVEQRPALWQRVARKLTR